VIASLLPNKPRGVPRVDDRRVLNGGILQTGAPWRALPKELGPRTTCYNRFVRQLLEYREGMKVYRIEKAGTPLPGQRHHGES
jgi:transposase